MYEHIQSTIFGGNYRELIRSWMRGEFDYLEFNNKISNILNIDVSILNLAMEKSITEIKLNKDLFDFSQQVRSNGVKIAFFTDNMDVFTKLFIPINNLANKFDNVFSSWEYKQLKADKNGELLEIAARRLKVPLQEILLVDDRDHIGEIMSSKGGKFYLYKDYENEFKRFKQWCQTNFIM